MIAGCAVKTDYTPLNKKVYSRNSIQHVQVFLSKEPENKYIEIGIINAKGKKRHKFDEMIQAIKIKAAEFGADAIIIMSMNETSEGSIATQGGYIIPIKNKDFNAIAIKFVE